MLGEGSISREQCSQLFEIATPEDTGDHFLTSFQSRPDGVQVVQVSALYRTSDRYARLDPGEALYQIADLQVHEPVQDEAERSFLIVLT